VRLTRRYLWLIVLALVAMALLAPYLPLQNPVRMNVPKRFSPPGADFWFGTDHLGRDVFSRVVHGSAFSLAIGALTILLSGVPGILVGIVGAAAPARLAGLLMRALDVLMSFPSLLLAVAVGAALGTVAGGAGRRLGFDVVQILQDRQGSQTLVAGKYVSPPLYLGFRQPIVAREEPGQTQTARTTMEWEVEYDALRRALLNVQASGDEFRVFLRLRR